MIEDIYPLTPLQQGMLFHAVRDPGAVYVEQFRARLDGIDVPRLRSAWDRVLRAHPVLRSAFLWEEGDRPLQAVLQEADLPFAVTTEDVGVEPFALDRAPLMRIALIDRGDGSHTFVWTHHHLLLDGWSVQLVLADAARAYAGEPLPERRPFRDFVTWLGHRDRSGELAFWRAELAGFEAATPLPLGGRGYGPHATLKAWLPAALTDALAATVRAHGVTVATIAQCAWALVLARHAGHDDVVFGVTVAGRSAGLDGVEEMVGLFINTLPTRVRIDPRATAPEWLREQHRRFDRLRAFEHSALADIQRATTAPLFETLVLLPSAARGDAPGLAWRDAGFVHERTSFPLTVALAPGGRVTLNYDTVAYDAAAAQRLSDHFVAALRELTGAGRVVDIALEAHPPVVAGPRVTYACLHELFEARADEAPDAIAVEDGGQSIAYEQLDRRANRLAQDLVDRGVRPETIVGVSLERSIELVVALLAVLKAGGAYLPLDPRLPEQRRALMAADAGAALVVTHVPGGEEDRLPRRATPSNAAYVIYTSGSTGRPKGVIADHRGLVNLIRSEHAPGRIALATSIGFDVSLQEIFGALATGGTLVVAADVHALPGLIEAGRIDTLHVTPTALHALDRLPERVIVAGEELVKTAALRDVPLVNHYGPTETHVVTTHTAEPGVGPVPIGRPIANTRAYVLDAHLHAALDGAVGELYIGGPGVARGYLNLPAVTAERFVPDPFVPGRLYRTGDLVRRRADGALEFVGRRDRQVKVRGHRVELGEIEAALGDAVVLLRDGRLVAYHRGPVDRERLERTLPAYMLPAAFVGVAEWPRTVNGKLDRAALPAPTLGRAHFEPPRTALEHSLAALWADVLKVDRVGLQDDFFALGGDSITAMRLIARAKREHGVSVAIGPWLERPTLAAFADAGGGSVTLLERGAGDAAPLVLVHPGSGDILGYAYLARALGGERDIYAIAAPDDLREVTVEALADCYVGQLPDGPLALGGWSFGGLVAYELASRLGAERVHAVVLMDTWHPSELVRLGLARPRAGATGVLELSRAAMVRYRPPAYDGRVILVRAADDPCARLSDPALGWGAVDVHSAPGKHDELLSEARAPAVATIVQEAIAR